MAARTHMQIPPDVHTILSAASIDGTKLKLTAQLDRPTYQKVMKVIDMLDGKWNRGQQCHIFPEPVADILGTTLEKGEVANQKNIRQAFYTPREIADQMCEAACISDFVKPRILEPSVGDGSLLIAAADYHTSAATVVGIEIDEATAKQTGQDFPKAEIVCQDFLTFHANPFDIILMNPPFTKNQDIAHIKHALSLLSTTRSSLVAITSQMAKNGTTKKHKEFHALLETESFYEWHDLPSGAFKSSGTSVATCMLTVRR